VKTPKELHAAYRKYVGTPDAYAYRLLYLIARLKDQPKALKEALAKAYPRASDWKLSHGHQPGLLKQLTMLRGWARLATNRHTYSPTDHPRIIAYVQRRAEICEMWRKKITEFFDTPEEALAVLQDISYTTNRKS
jgi:hypothetical protein